MPIQTTQIFLGDTPIPFYYLGDTQVGLNPTSEPSLLDGLIYNFNATFTASYPGTGSIWYDLSPNRLWASTFSSSVAPTFDTTNKEVDFNGSNNALMVFMSSSIATGSKITDFTQIIWVKEPGTQTGSAIGITNLSRGAVGIAVEFDAISFNDDTNVWRLTSENNNRNVTSVQTETVFNSYLMIAATRESGSNNYKIYRNGANIIATGSYTPTIYSASSAAGFYSSIGNRFFNLSVNSWASDGWWSGSLSSVTLYNRVLSTTEINRFYELGRSGSLS